MTRVSVLLSAAAAASLAAACTTTGTHQMARAEAASVLQTAPAQPYQIVYNAGRDSAAWGDRWTSGNLFERALDKAPDPNDRLNVQDRFNLADRYERTGRLAMAADLYRGVARDGRFLWGTTDPSYLDRSAPLTRINLGDEAARRLAMLEPQLTFAQGPGAPAATGAGVAASAIVGGPPAVGGRVSDAEAQRLDETGAP